MNTINHKRGLVIVFFVLMSFLAIGQTTSFTGQISDGEGSRISNVLITALESHAVTDANGFFEMLLTDYKNDSIVVSFSCLGFEELDTLLSLEQMAFITLKEKKYSLP